MSQYLEILPVTGPVAGTVRPPGSKSITNRALILAAMSDGVTTLDGVLDSQDTRVMIESLRRLGFRVQQDLRSCRCEVQGNGGLIPSARADLWLENSGTSIRFLTAVCALGSGEYRLDGAARMRQRPIGDLVRALRQLGADIRFEVAKSDCPPVIVSGAKGRMNGGNATVQSNISSQFLSALLMAAPACSSAVCLTVDGELVSKPYITMTLRMMEHFGVRVEHPDDLSAFRVEPQSYAARQYQIEPDASAASYFFAAAAITEGCVTVTGLTRDALQGDVQFVTALQQMGCEVRWDRDSITVIGRPLHGIDVDMNAISDTAQTLSVVAVFADSPTRIRDVGHMRHKETDRISAVANELRRAGIRVTEEPDGLLIEPGTPQPCSIETYDDHRMAMSFALLGLRIPGIRILDPECTAKTYPDYFSDLKSLCEAKSAEGTR